MQQKVPMSEDRETHIESADLFARGVTALPNHFFDNLMPQLNDTQWRVLCVVARATLGWRDAVEPTKRRHQDWLTHSQLQRRTGRTSSAISGAIDALVRRNFIQVRDSQGQWRLTSSERRSCRGKLFYCLTPRILMPHDMTSKSRIGKAKTTK